MAEYVFDAQRFATDPAYRQAFDNAPLTGDVFTTPQPTGGSYNPTVQQIEAAQTAQPAAQPAAQPQAFDANAWISAVMPNAAARPELPAGTKIEPALLQQQPGEQLTYTPATAAQVGATATAPTALASGVTAQPAATYTAQTVNGAAPQATAATGQIKPTDLVTAAQGTLSDETKQAFADTPQGTVTDDMTVAGQYKKLMDFEAGQVPDWAKGAVTTANEAMAARGLGSSSIASGAITGALASAALPIAQQDASANLTMGLKNLDVKAQSTIAKAQALAAMDMANLNNRQQAAVQNAQAFLQMDLTNLSNDQQTRVLNLQSRLQTLLSDQAATNAARQFNATSENQMTQFYDSLNSQIGQFNATQANAQAQFNAGQTNAMTQLAAQLDQQMQLWNSQNQLIVDQSNVQWRRSINTANTAAINAANQANATNLLNISNTSLNNLWQQMRDEASWAFTASENEKNRAANVAMTTLKYNQQVSLLGMEQQQQIGASVGSAVSSIFSSVADNWDDWFGGE